MACYITGLVAVASSASYHVCPYYIFPPQSTVPVCPDYPVIRYTLMVAAGCSDDVQDENIIHDMGNSTEISIVLMKNMCFKYHIIATNQFGDGEGSPRATICKHSHTSVG